ncbi:MAG: flagella assembly protein FlgT middle domain-containing protein [Gallionella sp.]|nr:flagella assembly protein FlgT middle domain-containing protein [Gallionella sp.]
MLVNVRASLAAVILVTVCLCAAEFAVAGPQATTAPHATDSGMGRVRAEGISTIGVGGRNIARQEALSDALRNVAALASAPAMGGKPHGTVNTSKHNPDAQSEQQESYYSIVREWENQGQYHIAVSAKVVRGKFNPEQAILLQTPRKKIVVIQFDVANTMHVDDINNIYDGLPVALSSQLKESGEFLPSYIGRSIPVETGTLQREAIIQIAGETGAQFLIAGVVMNAETSKEKWSLNMPLDLSVKVPFGGYKKRHIEVEFSVYDGLTGARQLLRRFDEYAEGDVKVGNNKPFGSSIFFGTEFGKATGRLIDSAVNEIQLTLENVPFAAHIIRVEGRKVFLDAGGDSLLNPGDKLVAYTSDTRLPIAELNGSVLGITDHAADVVTLTQVGAQFSIGELSEDAEKLGIKAGNIARVNLFDQHDLAAKRIAAQQLAKAQQEAAAEAERMKAEAAQAEAARIAAEKARIKAEQEAKAQALAAAKAAAKAAQLKAQQKTKSARLSAAQQARARALAIRAKAAQKAKAQAAQKAPVEPETQVESSCAKAEQTATAKAEASCAKAAQETKNQAAAVVDEQSRQAVKEGDGEGKPQYIKLPPKDTSKAKTKPGASSTAAKSQSAVRGETSENGPKYIKLPPGDAHQIKMQAKPAAK